MARAKLELHLIDKILAESNSYRKLNEDDTTPGSEALTDNPTFSTDATRAIDTDGPLDEELEQKETDNRPSTP